MIDQKFWKFHPQHMNYEQKFQRGTATEKRTIWGGGSVRSEWVVENNGTGRVGWEESEFEAECNFENERWVEICGKCRGHPETRSHEEPHSPTGT
jgi:hypothetical protein